MTEHSLKKRFIKYMSDHYSRMSTKDVESLLEKAIHRLTKTTHFNRGLLAEVIQEMTEEGYSRSEILAHVNIIDIEERT